MARYKHFFSPFAKVFLGAVFTYQALYWTWVKLEMEEVKADKNSMSCLFAFQVLLMFFPCALFDDALANSTC